MTLFQHQSPQWNKRLADVNAAFQVLNTRMTSLLRPGLMWFWAKDWAGPAVTRRKISAHSCIEMPPWTKSPAPPWMAMSELSRGESKDERRASDEKFLIRTALGLARALASLDSPCAVSHVRVMSGALARKVIWTEEEYLAMENESPIKHELYDGQVYAMAGALPDHNEICARAIIALGGLVGRGPCHVFTSDQRIHIPSGKLKYTYPDAGVRCGDRQLAPKDPKMSLMNPSVLVEVLSAATAEYDRGTKLLHYLQIPSLQDVLLIEVEQHWVEHHHRGPRGGWKKTVRRRGGIPLLGGVLRLEDLYQE
jgi:Uma2 family endonuclease